MRAQPASRSSVQRAALSDFQSEPADGVDDLKIDRDRDAVQPETPIAMLPLRGPGDPYVARYDVYPEDRKDKIRTAIGITLLAIAAIGLVFWGRWLFETRADPDAPPALTQEAPQPAPVSESANPAAVVPEAATNGATASPTPQQQEQSAPTPTATPPAPTSPPSAPQVPQRQPTPAVNATPATRATDASTVAPVATRGERPASPSPSQQGVTAASTGGLFAITRPIGAQVFLDDKLIGTTPLFLSSVPSGRHAIRLELTGFKPYASSIDIQANERFRVAAQLEQ